MKRHLLRPCSRAARSAAEAAALALSQRQDKTKRIAVRPVSGQQIMHMSEPDAAALAATRPDVIVEEDKPLRMFAMPGLAPVLPMAHGKTWEDTVTSESGIPIPDCTVFAAGPESTYRTETDASGVAQLRVDTARFERLIVSPRANFWSRVIPPLEDGKHAVSLRRLQPVASLKVLRGMIGMAALNVTRGRGVRVAVVDSSIAPVAGLTPAGGLNTLDGGDPVGFDVNERGHGTDVAGIIAVNQEPFRGLAPGVSMFSLKVFPGGFTSDLVEAMDCCRVNQIDHVNLSLGGHEWSPAIDHAIQLANSAGVTLVAATGNDATSVAFPAAHPDVIAVGAVGLSGGFYDDSGHALRVGRYSDWTGQLFGASFANFGRQVDVCAQGVAVVSWVPSGFACWDGKSMATPVVTALLAHALELNPGLKTGTRATADALRAIAVYGALNTAIPNVVEGFGPLNAPGMLAASAQVVA